MNVEQRIEIMVKLGRYMSGHETGWEEVKQKAFLQNNWFIPEFIDRSVKNISAEFLQKEALEKLVRLHPVKKNHIPKKVGLVMAGNIPLVGFHDMLCIFISGHHAFIKASSKDEVLIQHLVNKLLEWDPEAARYFVFQPMLKNCDAYIATGSNTTSTYFDYYFRNYPTIIRKNRTSVAIIRGNETPEDLEKLADDVYLYFGLGCRNVTKIFVPANYDFVPLLEAFKKYDFLKDHHKYRNNYDYNLAILLLNHKYYMSNDSILLVEDHQVFSPISQLNYEYYDKVEPVKEVLKNSDAIQCVVGEGGVPPGSSQVPGICDFADGVDTMKFLSQL
jgi:hypothetical protein